MATVTVRLFARLAELAGTRATDVEVGEGLRASDVFTRLSNEYPQLASLKASVMYAVNREYVDADHPLRAGDELAIIPPVSGGAVLCEVTGSILDPERLVAHVRKDEAGAVVLFYGVVRNENIGRKVEYLEYDAYSEMAEQVMRQIADEILETQPITDIAVQHRTGRLEIGEASLLVAVSSPHRGAAFEAAQEYVDQLKKRVPVWKKEVFEGGVEWIEGESSPPGGN